MMDYAWRMCGPECCNSPPQIQNIKNVKRCRDANKVGIMHESKVQYIGKAPSLHLFHTTVRQCMGVFLKRTTSSQSLLAVHGCSIVLRPLPPPSWPGNEASMTLLVALRYTEPLQQLKQCPIPTSFSHYS